MEETETFLFQYKGCYFVHSKIDVDFLEKVDDFEIRDDDVFIITYPKSGSPV
ncbi:Sulfotransferase 2B1 [Manis pentadactyla]|nr:Sulfotransferase 2B1 [Manis pentadactyla]